VRPRAEGAHTIGDASTFLGRSPVFLQNLAAGYLSIMLGMAQSSQVIEAPAAPAEHADERALRDDNGRKPLERASNAITMAVILVLIFSATVRLYELQRPNVLVFDETYYAKDAHTVLHGYLGPNPLYSWEPGKEISWPHPEYGKFAIAVGEATFGNVSFGWRIVSAICGTLLLVLVYPLGRRFGLSPPWALLGLILAASDFLGIVQSRIATLDIFVALWSVLCIYLALRYVQTGHRLRWLFLCGLAGGLALGTKWSGGFAVVSAAAIMLLYRRRSWRRPVGPLIVNSLRDVVLPAVALLVLPVAAYFASYTVYFLKGHHTLSQWWQLQHQMWWFNENLHATHTYASKAYTWIFDYRPVWYYYVQIHNTVHGIISIGNPLLWWASVPALLGLAVLAAWRRDLELALLPLMVALLYLPWLHASRTSFMYYMTPVAPFMALAVAMALRELSASRLPRPQWAVLLFAVTAAVTALLWYQIGQAAAWLFWRDPNSVSLELARVVLLVAIGVAACGLLTLTLLPRARLVWRYLTWVYAGAVTGVMLAFLPILIDLSVSVSHFYHLMWFRNWI
jgi:dolichyl-phosphate-mannose-protein mannosyltransferase